MSDWRSKYVEGDTIETTTSIPVTENAEVCVTPGALGVLHRRLSAPQTWEATFGGITAQVFECDIQKPEPVRVLVKALRSFIPAFERIVESAEVQEFKWVELLPFIQKIYDARKGIPGLENELRDAAPA